MIVEGHGRDLTCVGRAGIVGVVGAGDGTQRCKNPGVQLTAAQESLFCLVAPCLASDSGIYALSLLS